MIEVNEVKVTSIVKAIDVLKESENLLAYSLSEKADKIKELDIEIEDKEAITKNFQMLFHLLKTL